MSNLNRKLHRRNRPAPGRRTDTVGIPMSRDEAIARGMWGWRWASIAEASGWRIAAAERLPEPEELMARKMAEALVRECPGGTWSHSADVDAAIAAFAATVPVLRTALSGRSVSPAEVAQMDQLLRTAEQAGRNASVPCRTHWHLERMLEASK